MKDIETLAIPYGYEFDRAEDGKVILKKTCKDFPVRYTDAVKGLDYTPIAANVPKGFQKAMLSLCELLVYRNAWWERLEWEPDWMKIKDKKYCIHSDRGFISITTHSSFPRILSFPDNETANLFLNTFRNLIEEAKELL